MTKQHPTTLGRLLVDDQGKNRDFWYGLVVKVSGEDMAIQVRSEVDKLLTELMRPAVGKQLDAVMEFPVRLLLRTIETKYWSIKLDQEVIRETRDREVVVQRQKHLAVTRRSLDSVLKEFHRSLKLAIKRSIPGL